MEKIINYSVPQGSHLGPVLFNTYCSTLVEVIPTGISKMALLMTIHYKNVVNQEQSQKLKQMELLETSMTEVDYWMKENRLKPNPSKTEFIKFGYHSSGKK